MHASCKSPCHLSAKHCVLETCLFLTAPFRAMLLTMQGGVHAKVQRLMRYLNSSRYYYIPPLCFTAQCGSPVPAQGRQVCLCLLPHGHGNIHVSDLTSQTSIGFRA